MIAAITPLMGMVMIHAHTQVNGNAPTNCGQAFGSPYAHNGTSNGMSGAYRNFKMFCYERVRAPQFLPPRLKRSYFGDAAYAVFTIFPTTAKRSKCYGGIT